ncbi:hypothetical protein MKW98_026899 [Papaver atlanticum]|uniref:Uncharacterized protein n=1 Tax=Papaver atlanticum TaxID=357466 RepID=A0AAD4SUX3_9MAGN|nr:hypothetical protein MKW98_026899 [Papaver atlanticum]
MALFCSVVRVFNLWRSHLHQTILGPGEETPLGRSASNNKLSPSPRDEEMPLGQLAPSIKDLQTESGRGTPQYPDTPAKVLQDIAINCGSKVWFSVEK